jgi:hypothetical protein
VPVDLAAREEIGECQLLEGGAAPVGRDAVARIGELKERSRSDIVQYGFGELSYGLMHAGLLDELRLWIHPFLVGRAATDDLLFRPGAPSLFGYADSTVLKSGIVILRYVAAG